MPDESVCRVPKVCANFQYKTSRRRVVSVYNISWFKLLTDSVYMHLKNGDSPTQLGLVIVTQNVPLKLTPRSYP